MFCQWGSHFLVNLLELLYILIMIIIDYGITYYDTSLLNFCLNTSGRTVVKKKCPSEGSGFGRALVFHVATQGEVGAERTMTLGVLKDHVI